MAAGNPNEQQFWIDGLPFQGIAKVGNDTGAEKFWIDGLPAEFILVATGGGGGGIKSLLIIGVGA